MLLLYVCANVVIVTNAFSTYLQFVNRLILTIRKLNEGVYLRNRGGLGIYMYYVRKINFSIKRY